MLLLLILIVLLVLILILILFVLLLVFTSALVLFIFLLLVLILLVLLFAAASAAIFLFLQHLLCIGQVIACSIIRGIFQQALLIRLDGILPFLPVHESVADVIGGRGRIRIGGGMTGACLILLHRILVALLLVQRVPKIEKPRGRH